MLLRHPPQRRLGFVRRRRLTMRAGRRRRRIIEFAGGWLTKAARKAVLKGYRVLRGPLFVTGADADGDVGVPGGVRAVWWGRG